MSDKNLLDRWCRLVRIAPNENNQSNERSWVDKSKSLLPIEKKIYAIKVVDNHEAVSIGYQSVLKSKKSKSPAECVRKWIGKCKWRVPKVAVLFSFIQILFHLTGPASLAYQTLAFSPICKLELWRYFTYALLHAGTAHLVINIILQLVVALPLESEVGRLNLLVVYVGGIVSGSLAASLVPDFTLLVGSSSGVYSLLMSHIPNIILNFSSISHRTHRIIFVIVLSVSDVIYAIIHCLENREPQIAMRSHLAGAVFGVLLGFIFYTNREKDCHEQDTNFKFLRRLSIVCCCCFPVVVIVLNVTG